jgi:hypothetical protein
MPFDVAELFASVGGDAEIPRISELFMRMTCATQRCCS